MDLIIPNELSAQLADREVKSALEATHAHNLELIALVRVASSRSVHNLFKGV